MVCWNNQIRIEKVPRKHFSCMIFVCYAEARNRLLFEKGSLLDFWQGSKYASDMSM